MLEIEKKYLVNEIPSISNCQYNSIEQGYLSFSPEIRIRRKDDKYYLTKKSDGLEVREEVETEIDEVAYCILKMMVQGKMISKTRFLVPVGDYTAELDIYHGDYEGLFTVETEFPSEEEAMAFDAPEWYGLEITQDKRYKNKNLAKAESVEELKNRNCNLERAKCKELI